MLGVIAMQVSPHGLAWLFLCITSILVLLESLNNPLQAASVAYYRMFEVGVGVLSAIIVANLLQDWHREPPPTAPGWRHLLDAQWPVVLHGARSAIAVCVVMAIWMALEVPQVVEMAITVAVVMAAPVGRRRRVRHPACHRRALAAPLPGLPAGRRRGARLPGAGRDSRSCGGSA